MSSKHIKLYFSMSDSGKTIDLSNENDNGDANGDANDGDANDGDANDGDVDDDDDGYVTGDSADVSDVDDYLQNKGCDTIVSARQNNTSSNKNFGC